MQFNILKVYLQNIIIMHTGKKNSSKKIFLLYFFNNIFLNIKGFI